LNPRIILITGASSGIGREMVRQLIQKGDYPLLVARDRNMLQKIKNESSHCEIFPCDITQPEQVKQLVDEVIHQFGRVDVLVNNAGYGRFGGSLDLPLTDYSGMMNTNYLGAVHLTHTLLPYMLVQGHGRIINISSIAGLTGIPNLAAYCASKFALIGFSEALHLEYYPMIQVGVLCPGPVQTPFFQDTDPSNHFPAPIYRQLIDVQTVARHAIQLIKRPRIKVIPRSLSWAIKVRRLAPAFYLWATKKMYDSFKKKERYQQQAQHVEENEPCDCL
jgi:uncharacterized protein